MKQILFSLSLIAMTPLFFISSDNFDYEKAWKEVENAISEGLPKTALEKANAIYDHAVSEDNHVQQLKAVSYTTNLVLYTEELGLENIIEDIEQKIARTKSPSKNILHSYMSEIFQSYFNSQYHVISQRTNVVDLDSKDIRTWTPINFRSFISDQYFKSLDEDLKNIKTSDYKDLLNEDKNRDLELRPSLYHLLLDRALNYFMHAPLRGTNPTFGFKIANESFFDPALGFSVMEIVTEDKKSSEYNVLLLFQDAIREAHGRKDEKVKLDYDLKRLQYVYQNADIADKDEVYQNSLLKAIDSAKGEAQNHYRITLIDFMVNKGNYEDALVQVNQLDDKALSAHLRYRKESALYRIHEQSYNLILEEVVPVDRAIPFYVNSRNIDKLYLTVYNVDASFSDFQRGKKEKLFRYIRSLDVVKTISLDNLKKGLDLSSIENSIKDGFKNGHYIIGLSLKEYPKKDDAFQWTELHVSDIEYLTYYHEKEKRISVRDRWTGEPLENAKVELIANQYDHSKNKYNKRTTAVLQTNADGWAAITGVERNYSVKVTYKDDVLDNDKHDYLNTRFGRKRKTEKVEYFTDRSIYRPGQTVHFKILHLDIDEDLIPSIKPNSTLTVTLKDANRQVVSTVDVTTNDFGSASGQFILPQGLLTGKFSLSSNYGKQTINVEEYKRPKFKVSIEENATQYKIGDEISICGIAESLAGNALNDSKVSYSITRETYYRWRPYWSGVQESELIIQGETITGEDGKFNIDFKSDYKGEHKGKNVSYNYKVSVDVTDGNGDTRSASEILRVSAAPYNLNIDAEDDLDVNADNSITIKALNNSGQATSTKAMIQVIELEVPDEYKRKRKWENPGTYKLSKTEYDDLHLPAEYESDISKYPEKKHVYIGALDIAEDGVIWDVNPYLKAGNCYRVIVTGTNTENDIEIKAIHHISALDFDKAIFPMSKPLFIETPAKKAQIGSTYVVKVGTPLDEVWVHHYLSRGQESLKDEMFKLTKVQSFNYQIEEKDLGGLSFLLDAVLLNTNVVEAMHIDIPWTHKKLDVELITERDEIYPGSEEKWTIKINGIHLDELNTELLATMYDASLDQFMPHSFNSYAYPTRSLNNTIRFYNQGISYGNHLFYQWNRNDLKYVAPANVPVLHGIFNQYGVSIRGSRGGARESYSDGVRVMSKRSAPMMNEALEEEGLDNSYDLESVPDKSVGAVAAKPAGVSVEEGQQINTDEVSIRKNLNETVFFYPHLKSDKEGNVELSFTMNEALTTWKLLLFGHDKEYRFGTASTEVKTQKDVMVIPNPPRFFREGDALNFPSSVANLSSNSLEVSALFELFDPETGDQLNELFQIESSKKISIDPGKTEKLVWKVNVPSSYKKPVKYRVVVQSGDHSDGQEGVLPVVTNKVLVTDTKVISVKNNESKNVQFDALAKRFDQVDPYNYTFEYTANPVWYAIQAVPYLMEYPYSCSEQIFHKYYANALSAYIVNSNPKIKEIFDIWNVIDSDALLSNLEKNQELKSALIEETPWIRNAQSETEQKKRIALLFNLNTLSHNQNSLLNQIKNRQMPSGGFPWFPGGREDVYITQMIIEGFARLDQIGVIDINDSTYRTVITKGLAYIDRMTLKRYEDLKLRIHNYGGSLKDDHLDRLSIHYLYTRSFFSDAKIPNGSKEAYDYYHEQSEKYWLRKGLLSESIIGIYAFRTNKNYYQDIQKSLTERSFYSDELGRYWNRGTGFRWYELPIEGQSTLIQFYTEIGHDKSFIDDMKIWLIKNKQVNHWPTTKGTASAIYALLLENETKGAPKWISETNEPDITIGGVRFESDNVEAGTGYIKKSWKKDEITTDLSTITIKKNNDVPTWGAAYFQYFETIENVQAQDDNPLSVKRALYKEVMTDAGATLVRVGETSIVPGDKIITRIEIKVDRNMSYVHLKDMRSSALEPDNVLSSYKYKHGLGYYESTRDLTSNFFFSRLQKGTYVFEYPSRAVYIGDFTDGFSTIQSMYAPEFASRSQGGRIVIDE